MNKDPLLSFVVLSYNYEGYIGRTIRSILEQTVQDFEVVVVDDASTDKSREVVSAFNDPRIRLLVNEQNLGGAGSYNRAVTAARGEWLVNLDADDWIAPEKSAAQLTALTHDPSIDIIGTHVAFVDAEGTQHPRHATFETATNHNLDLNCVQSWIGRNPLCRSSTMVRRAAHLRIKLDDPTMVRAPDYELWTRALRDGCRFSLLPQSLTYYRLHDRGVTFGDPRGTFLELSYAMLSNLVPLIEARALWPIFSEILLWLDDQEELAKLSPGKQYKLLGAMFSVPGFRDFSAFNEMIQADDDSLRLAQVGHRCLALLRANPIVDRLKIDNLKLRSNYEAAAGARDWWQDQSRRWEAQLGQAQNAAAKRVRRLEADLDTALSDRIRSLTELTASLSVTQAQAAVARSDLAESLAIEALLRRQIASLEQRSAAGEAELTANRAMQASVAWRVVAGLNATARRHPRAARLARRLARVLWWTIRGRLISGLQFRRQIRSQLRAEAEARARPVIPFAQGDIQPACPPQPPAVSAPLIVLDETGHRPSLRAGQQRSDDWPLVSVVITSFNYGAFVAKAVDSVLAQTFKDLEVIVVEGGSTNQESRLMVAGFHRPRTRVLMQGPGRRAGANRNFGISQARGRYVCCLDADDTLAPTYIEKALFLLERHGYDVVSSALMMVGAENGQVDILEQPRLDDILEGNHVLTTAVFRWSHWKQVGGYRDVDRAVSGHVHEDWAFWVRLAAMGARFRNLHRDPMLRYLVHATSLSRATDVLPIARQRELVRQMNQDVLEPIDERVALSQKRASIRYQTPSAPPAVITLDRSPPNQKPPTLLLAMPFLLLGGGERILSTVVAHLKQIGWRVVIITTIEAGGEHGETTPWFEVHTSEIFHLPRCLPTDLWEDFVHHLVRSRGVEIVWVVGSAFVYDCLRGLRAAFPGLRVVDLLFNTVGHTANNRRRRDLIDLIFVENNEVRSWLLAHGEDEVRIRLVESGVDLTALHPMARAETLIREIGAAPDDLIVGFSGRWSEEKNPLGFVEIARQVDPTLPIRFVMTGTGHQRGAIEHAIREAHFPDGRFYLLGEVPEIAPILASYDLLVIPSVLDGRPVVVLEALAMGVPVLASRIGGIPDLRQDGRTGWLCEPNALEDFAKRIEGAARDLPALVEMRRQARTYAESNLDRQGMLTAYRAGLTSLLAADRCNA